MNETIIREILAIIDDQRERANRIGPHLATSPGAKLYYNGKDSALVQLRDTICRTYRIKEPGRPVENLKQQV